ncbi:MAG: hypothetical protein A2Z17_06750, partial [Gammaproteobacteria bacterium RBG_16_66_13]
MCRAAVEVGLGEIGFTEHADEDPADDCRGFFRVDEWWKEIDRCRARFGEALRIRAGIEIGEPHRYPAYASALLSAHPWDFVLASLHWVGGLLVFDQAYFRRSEALAYGAYFEELAVMAEAAEFDVLAHADIVKRYGFHAYGPFEPEKYETNIRRALRALAQREKALEINTGTLRRPVGETSPAHTFLQWFLEEGGRWVTVGSDAHEPTDVGRDLASAAAQVRQAGFPGLARLEARTLRLAAWDSLIPPSGPD